MKKLLLILLCLPMIGFGQNRIFNLDKKYANTPIINLGDFGTDTYSSQWANSLLGLENNFGESCGINSLDVEWFGDGASSLLPLCRDKARYNGRVFTGQVVSTKKSKCPAFWFARGTFSGLPRDKWDEFTAEYCFIDSIYTFEIKVANDTWKDVFSRHATEYNGGSNCAEEEAYEITYYDQGIPKHTALIWECGYKYVVDWYIRNPESKYYSDLYQNSSSTFYYPSNNILEYRKLDNSVEVMKYYKDGSLFEKQKYFYKEQKQWIAMYDEISNKASNERWLSSRAFYDSEGDRIQEVNFSFIDDLGYETYSSNTIYLDKSKRLKTDPFWTYWHSNYSPHYKSNNIDIYNLETFVNVFLIECDDRGINFPHQNITITFEELEGTTIALSYGLGLEREIIIKVDPTNWKNSSIEKKWYIIYHELGHDVLNLEHGQAGKMMFNFADREYHWLEFIQDKKEMFDYYKNK